MCRTKAQRRALHQVRRNRVKVSDAVRAYVLERDNHECQSCGSTRRLTLHHIIYRFYGGSNEAENLVTICSLCHCYEHSNDVWHEAPTGVY